MEQQCRHRTCFTCGCGCAGAPALCTHLALPRCHPLHTSRRRVLYHGPVQDVLPHFSALGFECPSRKEPPSFLQASEGGGNWWAGL